jgi:GNAT superfamily N-acetyltransferase
MTNAQLLQQLIKVPYLPLLGPVHPEYVTEQLLAEIFSSESAGQLLPFDKDRRWYSSKPAIILFDAIKRNANGLIVPVLSKKTERVKLLCYGKVTQGELRQCIEATRGSHPTCRIFIVSFAPDAMAEDDASIIFLKSFSSIDIQPDNPAVERTGVENAGSLVSLADDVENVGFGFLAQQYGNRKLGPTFVVRDRGQVVAAVGPIDLMPDFDGHAVCLPPYVGVASKYRGRGLGSQVWKAAMSYAAVTGATYLLLQSVAGEASEYFYESQGLVRLGAVMSRQIV